jgi:glycosyltransferase involved in cell wall biosynthesis
MGPMRILVFAYACEPGRGSEPGAGWAWARMLARFGETWVVTRANNQTAIEAGLLDAPERDRLRFVYVDLPSWAHGWKRGRRGIHLYYLLWQLAALRAARRLQAENGFDLVWHVTLANVWFGSVAPFVGPPVVYGPVGGGARVPLRLLPVLGVRGTGAEAVRMTVQLVSRYMNPLARVAWRRSCLVLVQNHETRRWLPRRYRPGVEVFQNIVLDDLPVRRGRDRPGRDRPGPPTAVYAGDLLPLKGVALALRALAYLPDLRLLVVGSGTDEARLRRLTNRLGLGGRVRFVGRIPRDRLLRLLHEDADVFLFPSLRDQAPWVVAEARASGLPVVCLDIGGPPLLGGRAVRPASPRRTAQALALELRAVLTEPAAPPPVFDLASRSDRLADLLRRRYLMTPLPRREEPAHGSATRASAADAGRPTPAQMKGMQR